MATTLHPGPFSNPELLRRIRRDLLLAWLWPLREFLARRGVTPPAPEQPEVGIDYERLAGVFMEPGPEMPAEFLEALFVFRELSTEAGMDAIFDAARRRGLDLKLDGEAEPADVVVCAWLADRALVAELHNRMEMERPRAFTYFSASVPHPVEFPGPSAEQVALLEARLNSFYQAWRRGRGARVVAYREGEEWWFLVRHGAACRREEVLEEGQPSALFFRPRCCDVLVYAAARAEIRINCCTVRERRVLLRVFGRCLFGRSDFFNDAVKYTLAPLVSSGRACLACADVPGIEQVCLKEVELHYRDEPPHRDTLRADDIFELVEQARLRWPSRIEEITRATFEVKLCRARRPRRVTIVPSSKALYGRDSDSLLVERLFQVRGFILDAARG
jgi:hypothetical protein